tara:strand:- start:517 stop:1323 length:807 start_codon:yes stop_codon:yes gene_type:complete
MNIPDYRKDTAHLMPIEHYIYRTLIDQYYSDEKPVADDLKAIMRRLRLSADEELQMLKNVLSDFFELIDGQYRHKRIDDEIEKYRENAEKNRKNGSKGGRPPKNKTQNNPVGYESVTSGLPLVTQTEPNSKATNNYKTKNYETNLKDKTDVSVFDFDEFWNMYDKKSGRKKCEDKYSKLTEAQRDLIKQSLQDYVSSTNTDGTYPTRKDPLTYLNGECWNDEIMITTLNKGINYGQQQSASPPTSDIERYKQSLRGNLSTATAIRDIN